MHTLKLRSGSATDLTADGEDTPLDADYCSADIHPDTLAEMTSDCEDFTEANSELLEQAYATGNYDEGQAGHDFWLTRNGHGAGFWDRGLGKIGDQLTEAAKSYGSVNLYAYDGMVHS